jgi:hypothetical protein
MKYPAIILLFIYPILAAGQVYPADGDSLHYRIIGFEVPVSKTAKAYLLEVFDIEQPGQPIISQEHTANKMIATLPSFGKGYIWRVKYLKIEQTGIPDAIPAEMCYLGWQESLDKLMRLVEPEIPDA